MFGASVGQNNRVYINRKRLNRHFRIALSMGNQWMNPLDINVELTDTLPTGHFAFTPRRRH
jgi:hypothetical protein